MGVTHVFHAVGDQIAARQRVQHAVVPHGDAVIHGNGIEFLGNAAGLFNLACHQLPHVFQVDVAGHELGKGIGNGDDGFAEIAFGHAGGTPQGAGTGHVAAMGGGTGAVSWHGVLFQTIDVQSGRQKAKTQVGYNPGPDST